MSLVEQKKQIRETMRQQRASLSVLESQESARMVCKNLQQLLHKDRYPMALYLGFDGEIDTRPLIEFAWKHNYPVYLPVINATSQPMSFRQYQSDTPLAPNRYGIDEPVSGPVLAADALRTICMPLTAFDRHGRRLGMGGGYYDRTLTGRTPECLLIGLAHDFQELETCPVEPHDQLLDWIVTPREVIKIN